MTFGARLLLIGALGLAPLAAKAQPVTANPVPVAPATTTAVEPAVDAPEDKERAEPPLPPLIRLGDVRYEVVLWGRAVGMGQNGGVIAVVDAKTGSPTQMIKVYGSGPDNGKEEDKQDVFITAMVLDPAKTHLLVTNERGLRFSVNLKTLKVSSLEPLAPGRHHAPPRP